MRLLQIPVFGKYGAFDNLHEHVNGKAFADAVSRAASQYFGTAGIAYLERLTAAVNAGDDIGAAVVAITRQIAEDNLSPQEGRAAAAFALVATAGELATDYGITSCQLAARHLRHLPVPCLNPCTWQRFRPLPCRRGWFGR